MILKEQRHQFIIKLFDYHSRFHAGLYFLVYYANSYNYIKITVFSDSTICRLQHYDTTICRLQHHTVACCTFCLHIQSNCLQKCLDFQAQIFIQQVLSVINNKSSRISFRARRLQRTLTRSFSVDSGIDLENPKPLQVPVGIRISS